MGESLLRGGQSCLQGLSDLLETAVLFEPLGQVVQGLVLFLVGRLRQQRARLEQQQTSTDNQELGQQVRVALWKRPYGLQVLLSDRGQADVGNGEMPSFD